MAITWPTAVAIEHAKQRTKQNIKARKHYEGAKLTPEEVEFIRQLSINPIPVMRTITVPKAEIKRHYPNYSAPRRNKSWRSYDK